MLRLNFPMEMMLAFDGLKDSRYKTRETAIEDVGGFEIDELSVMFCNDEFICKLNKEWRDEDHATDVLSMSQHLPELKLPVFLMAIVLLAVSYGHMRSSLTCASMSALCLTRLNVNVRSSNACTHLLLQVLNRLGTSKHQTL